MFQKDNDSLDRCLAILNISETDPLSKNYSLNSICSRYTPGLISGHRKLTFSASAKIHMCNLDDE